MSDGKPTLEGVLDHYGAQFSPNRVSQMVHCPLHEDRTPSCSVHLSKDVWNCHSCGKGGDSYTLIMEKENCDFKRARALATSVGIAEGGAGGSDSELRGSRYGGGRTVSPGKRDRPRGGGYKPSWRRK